MQRERELRVSSLLALTKDCLLGYVYEKKKVMARNDVLLAGKEDMCFLK